MPGDEHIFDNNDAAYLQWIQQHPNGFVINTTRVDNPNYMALHRAGCSKITQYNQNAQPGGFTERDYKKICADDIVTLRAWLVQNGRPDGSFTSEQCPACRPNLP